MKEKHIFHKIICTFLYQIWFIKYSFMQQSDKNLINKIKNENEY